MNKKISKIIAIDGPAGSGKSTIAKLLADRLETIYLDTGAMYRAVTFKALNCKINLEDSKALSKIVKNIDIKIKKTIEGLRIILDGKDITNSLRNKDINNNISKIARDKNVRKRLVNIQRELAKNGGVIEGRDISTVVFPNADKKFYLDAHLDERIKRRYKQLVEKGKKIKIEEIKEEVINRDKNDRTRKIGPLRIAYDAVYVDTTGMSIMDVVDKLCGIINEN